MSDVVRIDARCFELTDEEVATRDELVARLRDARWWGTWVDQRTGVDILTTSTTYPTTPHLSTPTFAQLRYYDITSLTLIP